MIYNSGGVSQRHWFEIIVELPFVFILDLYVLLLKPADKHSRAPFSSNLLSCGLLDPPPTGTHTKAIRMLMVMLPMPDLSNASDRVFETVAITLRGW